DALGIVVVVVLQLLIERARALEREEIARNRERHVLLTHARKLKGQNEVILRLIHVEGGHPDPAPRPRHDGRRTTEEAAAQPVHTPLEVSKRLPTLQGG